MKMNVFQEMKINIKKDMMVIVTMKMKQKKCLLRTIHQMIIIKLMIRDLKQDQGHVQKQEDIRDQDPDLIQDQEDAVVQEADQEVHILGQLSRISEEEEEVLQEDFIEEALEETKDLFEEISHSINMEVIEDVI